MFPDPGQVYIANEILALERLGCSIRVFAYHKPEAPPRHAIFAQLRSPVVYLPSPAWGSWAEHIAAAGDCIIHNPGHVLRTVLYVIGHTLRNRSLHTWRRLAQAFCVAKGARRAGIRHLHAHFADGPARVAMLASGLTGTPYSFTTHARDIFREGVDRGLLREKITGASFVVCVSEHNKRFLEQEVGAPARKLHVVYNGVHLERFCPDASEDRQPGLILAVGRLVAKKGFEDLIEACRMLRDREVSFRCRIVGEGPLRSALERRAEKLRDAIEFAGTVSQEELTGEYRRASVVALPAAVPPDGNTDALPTVLLEAMASGCPTVSTRLAGIPEIIDDGGNGLLVDPGDVSGLTAAIERLLSNSELRARFGANARSKAERRFDVAKNAVSLYQLFRGVATVEPALGP
jgi:glycosyltransferase involved in cell wall biosynthesis